MSGTARIPAASARLSFPFGTRLIGADLAEATGYEPALLALHVRGAHHTWGVASGLSVRLEPGSRSVAVDPGVAFDCHGMPLVLVRVTSLPAPPATAASSPAGAVHDLVLERGPGCGATERGCETRDTPSRLPLARLAWRAAARSAGRGCAEAGARLAVPLMRFRLQASGLLTRVPDWATPVAQVLHRPRLARGTAAGGDLTWIAGPYDVRAWVDTTEAAFTTAPAYVVYPAGPTGTVPLVGPFLRVAGATERGFWLRAIFATRTAPALDAAARRAAAGQITFSWLGVEAGRGCPAKPAVQAAASVPDAALSPHAMPLHDILMHLGLFT